MNNAIQRYLLTIFFSTIGYGAYNAVNILFFLEKGLSFQAISTLFILLNLFVLLCEIPTGIVADRIKPVNAVIVGSCILVISRIFLMLEFSYSLEVAMIIYGIGISFISGAANAVLVGLKSAYESSERLFSWSMTYRSLGAILGGAGAYYLFKLNIDYPWIYSSLAYFIVVIILFCYRHDYQFPSKEKWNFVDFLPLSRKLINQPFFWASVFFATSALAPFLLWQYLFKHFPYGVEWGYVALQLGMLASSKLARAIRFTDARRYTVIVLNLLVMLLMPLYSDCFWIIFILLISHVFLVGLQNVFFSANFHDNLSQETRSTSESLMSAFDSCLAMPMLFLIGYFMDNSLMLFAFGVSICSGAFSLYFFVRSRQPRLSKHLTV